MAPVPEDNRNTPSGDDDEHFRNPNLTIPIGSDSSDSDASEGNVDINGYSLLPQEPEDESGFNSDDENIHNVENIGDDNQQISAATEVLANGAHTSLDGLTGSFLSSDEAEAPTVSASNESYHPVFLAQFPDGKLPSYMQVSKVTQDKEDLLWNQQRQETSKITLDLAHESKILKAMSEFSLPKENIPEWARYLPDDQWNEQVVNRIGIVAGKEKHSANTRLPTSSKSSNSTSETKDSLVTDVWVADFSDSNINPTTSDTEQK